MQRSRDFWGRLGRFLSHKGQYNGDLPLTYQETRLIPFSESPVPDPQGMNWLPVTINGTEYALMRYHGQFRLVDLRDIPEFMWDDSSYVGTQEQRNRHITYTNIGDWASTTSHLLRNIESITPGVMSWIRRLPGPVARKLASKLNTVLVNNGDIFKVFGYTTGMHAMLVYLRNGQRRKAQFELAKLLCYGGADILGLGVPWRIGMGIATSLIDSGYFAKKLLQYRKNRKRSKNSLPGNKTKRVR